MIQWTLTQVATSKLVPYAYNPRFISKNDFFQLQNSIEKFGLIEKPIVNIDFTIISGHQRVKALQAEKEIEVWMPDRLLKDEEVQEICIRMNRNHGEFDFDMLANHFSVGDLVDWGFSDSDLDIDEIKEAPKEKAKAHKLNIIFLAHEHLLEAEARIAEIVDEYMGASIKRKK